MGRLNLCGRCRGRGHSAKTCAAEIPVANPTTDDVVTLRRSGMTLKAIGDRFGVTREAIRLRLLRREALERRIRLRMWCSCGQKVEGVFDSYNALHAAIEPHRGHGINP